MVTNGSAQPADEQALKAGYGEVDITPELGHTMPGYFNERRADGVLDPLHCKALVLSRGDTTLAIAALDLLGVKAGLANKIREAVAEKTGIPADHVFVHTTHTHTGVTSSEVADRLPGQVAEAVAKAKAACVDEPRVTFGSKEEYTVAFIRRYLMKDGSVRTNPGRNNPDIVRPIGTIDPAVNVITFQSAKTLLVNFGLHLDCVGGTKYSADYPFHMTTAVKESLGDDWNILFLNACCGNVNHINVKDKDQLKGYEDSRRIGRTLAEAVLDAHENARTIPIDALDARTETVMCPAREVPDEMLQWARQQMNADKTKASVRKFNEQTPSRLLALAERKGTERPSEVIAYRIGPVGLVGLPAEVFVEVGRDIKTHSLLEPTLIVELTGGSMGYVPHPRGYDEGGYESTYAAAPNSPETPVLWSKAAVRMLNEMAK